MREEIEEYFASLCGGIDGETFESLSVVDRHWFKPSRSGRELINSERSRQDLKSGPIDMGFLRTLKAQQMNNTQIAKAMGVSRTRIVRAVRRIAA